MRILAFSPFVATFHLLFGASEVFAGFPSKMDKADMEKMTALMDNGKKKSSVAIDDLVLFVRYQNKKGRMLAKQWAKNKKFEHHARRLKTVSIRVINATALEVLANSRSIRYVEPEHNIKALPFKSGDDEIMGKVVSNRHLEESIGYGLNMVQAPELWNVLGNIIPANKLTVCVIDSGYGLGHEDLPDLSHNVTGFTTSTGPWNVDGYGHGTHTAGVIAAIGNNNIGISGVLRNPANFNIRIAKTLDDVGDGREADLVDAIEDCVDVGANIISMSLGTSSYSETVERACEDAWDSGALLISAAGNDGNSDYSYPASLSTVMSVAAVKITSSVASFSQYNDQVEIAAPGVDIASTFTLSQGTAFGYRSMSGTSMAAPFVTGVAAAVWSEFPACSNAQIRQVLIRTALLDDDIGCNDDVGFGVVQALEAYNLLQNEGCLAGDVAPEPVGGCAQDASYTYPPSAAPTAFQCPFNAFELTLVTDNWATETSWSLSDAEGNEIMFHDGYRNGREYIEKKCLPAEGGDYTFKIQDSEGDGICCNYGSGEYTISLDGEIVKTGGVFGGEEITDFTAPEQSYVCEDSATWIHTTFGGLSKTCRYVKNNPENRCHLEGVDGGRTTTGSQSCREACGTCLVDPNATPLPTSPPSPSPTSLPTPSPTLSPTPSPTPSPTGSPTPAPSGPPTASPSTSTPVPTGTTTDAPTEAPSPSPTASTPAPTEMPTKSPTREPTMQPTNQPTLSPSPSPTTSPTSRETADPTPSPSELVVLAPPKTDPPTQSPSDSTSNPTPSPSGGPTSSPTSSPTPNPTPTPTPSPSSPPTVSPTANSSPAPTSRVTDNPTVPPSAPPTTPPSKSPTRSPTPNPSPAPTPSPSSPPTVSPTANNTPAPTSRVTDNPTAQPSAPPTAPPSKSPTRSPTAAPTMKPSLTPTRSPSRAPTSAPSKGQGTTEGNKAGEKVCLSDTHEDGVFSQPCSFPFEHKKKVYWACTEDGWKGTPWCLHEDGLSWGVCELSSECLTGSNNEVANLPSPSPTKKGKKGKRRRY